MRHILRTARASLVLAVAVGLMAAVGCGSEGDKNKGKDASRKDDAKAQAKAQAKGEPKPEGNEAKPQAAGLKKSEVLIQLPGDTCNTPDGMCLLPDGGFLLSVPNFNDQKQPPLLMKITKDNKAEVFFKLPDNPDSGKPFGPLGICQAPNGDFFVADFQAEGDRKSRVVRIVMKDGKPVEAKPVVTGFHVSNAVVVRDGFLYVSETQIDTKAKPSISGIMRFTLKELEGEKPVALAEDELKDPHLIATIECADETLPLGADGLCFDKKGNLYCGNFAGATVHKLEFDADGKVKSNTIFAKADFMKSCDGLAFDPETETIYVADSRANAIQAVTMDGRVTTLAQNGDTDGTDGGMDQPCEPLLRGRELIVSNMDWPVPGCINQKYDKPAVITVIRLDK